MGISHSFPAQVHNLYVNIEVLADQGDNDKTEDIDDRDAFPKAVIQLDCILARPANCRAYHAMADDADWPEADDATTAKPSRATVMVGRMSRVKRATARVKIAAGGAGKAAKLAAANAENRDHRDDDASAVSQASASAASQASAASAI